MPPSVIFQLFKKTRCRQLRVIASLDLSRGALTKLRRNVKGRPEILWFGTRYVGDGKAKVGHSIVIQPTHKKNRFNISMFWFLTESDPPPDFLPLEPVEDYLAE